MEVLNEKVYNDKKELILDLKKEYKYIQQDFTNQMFYKFLLKGQDIKRTKLVNNYDNTYKITFFDKNGYKTEYLIKR